MAVTKVRWSGDWVDQLDDVPTENDSAALSMPLDQQPAEDCCAKVRVPMKHPWSTFNAWTGRVRMIPLDDELRSYGNQVPLKQCVHCWSTLHYDEACHPRCLAEQLEEYHRSLAANYVDEPGHNRFLTRWNVKCNECGVIVHHNEVAGYNNDVIVCGDCWGCERSYCNEC